MIQVLFSEPGKLLGIAVKHDFSGVLISGSNQGDQWSNLTVGGTRQSVARPPA